MYDTHDILVMTAQVFLDNLRHAYVKLADIALMVFDECHHARKSHPYNCIMKEFYFRSNPGDRPRILGLTASPVATGPKKIKTEDKVKKEIIKLERNLDAEVIRPKNSEIVAMSFSRPEEILIQFQPTPLATIARVESLLKDAPSMSIAAHELPVRAPAMAIAAQHQNLRHPKPLRLRCRKCNSNKTRGTNGECCVSETGRCHCV